MADRYEIDIEKKASSYLNSLATALGEGKKRALIELKQADTFVNRLFNRKKLINWRKWRIVMQLMKMM